jgi:uncharacterized protein
MTPLQAAAVLGAGFVAGGMNAVVGAGTLVSFPALLAVGLSPVVANVSSSLGVLPGSLAGAFAYRRQLGPLQPFLRRAVLPAALGGLVGALVLLLLPARVFAAVVPVLLVVAAALVAVQPRVARAVAARRPAGADDATAAPAEAAAPPGLVILGVVALVAVYGGYFGAGVSVMYLAVLGAVLGGIQAANGAKNVLSTVSGLAAAVVFVLHAPVDWAAVVLLAAGSALGGLVGGSYGRRLPDLLLRAVIIMVALVAATVLVVR